MADLAIMMAGCISVPLYATLDQNSLQSILQHSESKAIIVGKLDDYMKQAPGVPEMLKIGVGLYGIQEENTWEEIIQQTPPLEMFAETSPDDLLSIMYTSGTTGTPKGVMHTASNFNEVVNCALKVMHIPDHPKYFSYLPLSHIAERVGIEMSAIYRGACVSFPESLETFAEDLGSVQPDTFFGVPRIWEKFQEKVLEKMPQKKLDRLLSIPIISGIVKKKIQKALGLHGSVLNFSGAAPIAVSLKEWYMKLGIEICQAYGMTEDCIMSHFNLPGANRFGKVGPPLPGVTSKLSEEGEVLVKNPSLMKGYYKEPELTAAMFTGDGFLKTGDLGEFDHDGWLSITGRLKDQFKTDKGKYVSPAPIELEFLKNPFVEQICVVGTGIPHPIALIILSAAGNLKDKSEVEDSLEATIRSVNPSLASHEKVAKCVIMKEEWSTENGLMTPTLKVKRNRVEAIHQPFYREWFEREEIVVYE
jgi:long-chain acyl-CoA synthetase